MVNMISCDHIVCKECFVGHYSLVINEKGIKFLHCLLCGEPEISSETVGTNLYLQMFRDLMQAHMSYKDYILYAQKIYEHTLMKDHRFLWCIKVGLLNVVNRLGTQLPHLLLGHT